MKLLIIIGFVILISCFLFWLKKKESNHIESVDLPWGKSQSIYAYIKTNLESNGKLTAEKSEMLPDDDKANKYGGGRFMSGAKDNIFSHHWDIATKDKLIKRAFSLIIGIAKKDSLSDKVALYNLLAKDELSEFIDPLLDRVFESEIATRPYLHEYALLLIKQSPDRGAVKFGIALLGAIKNKSDAELIKLMAKHDEFTLYSVVALSNILKNPTQELWQIAQCVDGWGKINAIEWMSNIDDPKIKDWLLRKGYKNTIMDEYLAYKCATDGDLRFAVSGNEVDDELLNSAGEIIEALINGGPAKNIKEYADGSFVVDRYLKLMQGRADTLNHFVTVDVIRNFVSKNIEEWKEREKFGWTNTKREELQSLADKILKDSKWEQITLRSLDTDDNEQFYLADRASKILKMDNWNICLKRLQNKPLDSVRWYAIMQTVNEERIQLIIDFARKSIPLNEIATGPKNEPGYGKAYIKHGCLDYVLQGLNNYPGKGLDLIQTGLKSPTVRNRYTALKTLEEWGPSNWSEEITETLHNAVSLEPDKETQEKMKKLIESKSLDKE